MAVDLLILGAGWTSDFLIPLCEDRGIKYAATSRSGRDSTIQFVFDPDSDDRRPYEALPDAQTVLITFPIDRTGGSRRLVDNYRSTRGYSIPNLGFIQLGTTSIWDGTKDVVDGAKKRNTQWYDRHSPYTKTPRAISEDELLALSPDTSTTVLNLAGLWGGQRSTRNWVARVAPTKEALRNKGSIHMIHGVDVARAILVVHGSFPQAQGKRWILTDGRIYDWWDLASAWGTPLRDAAASVNVQDANQLSANLMQPSEDQQQGPQARWVRELMEEHGVLGLPRNVELLGRALDSRDFWATFGLSPIKARLEG